MDGIDVVAVAKLIPVNVELVLYNLGPEPDITMEPCLNGPLVESSVDEPVKKITIKKVKLETLFSTSIVVNDEFSPNSIAGFVPKMFET